MRAMILAAGYGTRLYPLTENTPKPLLPIAGKPLMNYLLDRVRALPHLREVLVVTNNKFYETFSNWAKQNQSRSLPIRVVNDQTNSPDDRLGSVGDIDFTIRQCSLDDDLLILGGDNLFDYPLNEFMSFARAKTPAVTIGVYDIHNLEEAKQFGVVTLNDKNKVTAFFEKPSQPQSSLVAMCFYYMPKESLRLVSDYLAGTHKVDKAGDYIDWLSREKEVYGFQFKGRWYDIGSLEAYQEAQKDFLNLQKRQG